MKLFLDSSTNYLYLSLYDEKEIAYLIRPSKNDHSETLVEVLKNFLKDNNVKIDDLDSLFVGRGPGSYTGVRISGTVAKVLALVKNIKLYSFSTLDLLLASIIDEKEGKYAARIIAKKNHSYYKIVKTYEKGLTILQDDAFKNDLDIIFDDAIVVDASFDTLNRSNLASKLLKYNLYQEEDVYNYVPNYLRNEING